MTIASARLALALAAGLALLPFGAQAQIAVSANDNKAYLDNGVAKTVPNAQPDTVAIIDLSANPPKLLAEIQAPASVAGPPGSVAVAADESFALVTAAMKVDPADPTKQVPDDRLSVIDLKSSPPKVTQTVTVGKGAAGVSINKAGTLALVANRSEGTVSVLTISGGKVEEKEKIKLGEANSGPSHPVFTRDGAMALVTRDNDHKISVADGCRRQGRVWQARHQRRAAPLPDRHHRQRRRRDRRQYRHRRRRRRYDQRHRPQVEAVAGREHRHRRADARGAEDVAGRPARRRDGDERLEQAKGIAVLQRFRPGEDLPPLRPQPDAGRGSAGRALVPGRRLVEGRQADPRPVHGREGGLRLLLRRRQEPAEDRLDQGQRRRRRHPHRGTIGRARTFLSPAGIAGRASCLKLLRGPERPPTSFDCAGHANAAAGGRGEAR